MIYPKSIIAYEYKKIMTNSALRKKLYENYFNVYNSENHELVYENISFKKLVKEYNFDGRHLFCILNNKKEIRSYYFKTWMNKDKNNRILEFIEVWYNGQKIGIFTDHYELETKLNMHWKSIRSYVYGNIILTYLKSDPRPQSRNYIIEPII